MTSIPTTQKVANTVNWYQDVGGDAADLTKWVLAFGTVTGGIWKHLDLWVRKKP